MTDIIFYRPTADFMWRWTSKEVGLISDKWLIKVTRCTLADAQGDKTFFLLLIILCEFMMCRFANKAVGVRPHYGYALCVCVCVCVCVCACVSVCACVCV